LLKKIISFLKILFIKTFPILCFVCLSLLLFLYITKNGIKTTEIPIKVQIEGAVNTPGIKSLSSNSRIIDLIQIAGGYQQDYDQAYVDAKLNLAQKVKDGDRIFIPFKKSETLSATDTISKSGKININTADLKQLDSLPGIGESRATKIIANRPYKNVQELLDKKTITKDVFQKIIDQIEV
jgi:competence protein ComEA